VKEETGLSVEVARLLGVYSDPGSGRIIHYPEAIVHGIDIFIEARIAGGKLSISAESEELEYFSPDCLPSDLVPSSVPLLKDVLTGSIGQIL
jgi:ADP-ribose pyrophosphatase YjhB (NUDIX family)